MIQEYGNDFKLVLDRPHLPYRPGDTLSGVITKVPEKENVESIQITLTGEAKYTIDSSDSQAKQEQYTVPILSRTFEVLQHAAQEWRFEVAIPITANRNSQAIDSCIPPTASSADKQYFATEEEHSLPPTKPCDEATEGDYRYTSSVVYGIRPSSIKQRDVEKPVRIVRPMLMLWITKLCDPTEMAPVDVLSAIAKHQISIQDKKTKRVSTSTTTFPTYDFEVKFSGPSHIHVGDQFNISIDVEALQTSWLDINTAQIPLSLSRLHVCISCVWHAYGEKLYSFESLTPATWDIVSQKKPHHFPDFEASSRKANFMTEVGSLGHYVIPDFKTFHISIAHKLCVLAQFSSGKQTMACKAEIPIRVLPKPRRSTDNGETKGFVEGPQDIREDWGPVVLYPAAAAPLAAEGQNGDPFLGALGTVNANLELTNAADGNCGCCSVM